MIIPIALYLAAQDDMKLTVSNSNALGFKMLAEMSGKSKDNICISPLSVTTAGTMLRRGSSALSGPMLAKLLNHGGQSESQATAGVQAIYSSLVGYRNAGVLFTANGVWSSTKWPVKKSYTDEMQSLFGAEARSMDLGQEDAHKKVNQWVADHTNNRIKDLFEKFDSQTCLVLANCVFFKDQWQKGGHDADEIEFKTGPASMKSVKAFTVGTPDYDANSVFQRVTLPYKSNLMMEVYLPEENGSPEKVLGSSEFAKAVGTEGKDSALRAILPKWKSEYTLPLAAYWKSHGGEFLFQQGRKLFPGIIDQESWIQQAVHKTFIQVDENGTEAAAATGIAVGTRGAPPRNLPIVTFDRPFVYAITDPKTKTVLFVGVVKNPSF